jgi:integrase
MARTAKKLNVRKIKHCIEPGRYSDGDGLFVQITKSGVRSWLFRYSVRGKERWMGLGPLDGADGATVSLDEARNKAEIARTLLKAGIDPLDQKAAERDAAEKARKLAAIEKATQVTFADAAQQFYAKQRPEWSNVKHAKQFLSTMKKYVFPTLGELPVASINTPLVLSVLKPIWETKTVTASRIRARIENVLDWATASVLRTGDNPAKVVTALLPRKSRIAKTIHHKAMAYDEVPAFVAELANLAGDAPDAPVAPKALQFLILTTARSEEVRGLRRSEIDFENKVWTVPAGRIKGRKLHRVPLVDRAIQILRSLPDEGELFFIGSRKKSAIGDNVMLDLIGAMGHDATVHGFRSSFRDWAEERTNFSHEAKEMSLAHKVGDTTERSYKRTDILEKRRKLMEAWAAFCLTPKRDASVTDIGAVRGAARKSGKRGAS